MDNLVPDHLQEIEEAIRHGVRFRMFKDKNGDEFVLSPWGGMQRVYKVFDTTPPPPQWDYEMEIYPS